MLPRVMEQCQYESTVELQLLVVHIRTVSLSSRFGDKEMKVRVKHGDMGVSSVCDTAAVRFSREPAFRSRLPSRPFGFSRESAVADFDTSCVFLCQGIPSSSLRIRLVSGSGRGRAVGGASVLLHGDAKGLQEFDVQLSGLPGVLAPRSVEALGRVSVATEIRKMSRGDLQRHLECLHAQEPQGSSVLAEAPAAVGRVRSDSEGAGDDDVAPGPPA